MSLLGIDVGSTGCKVAAFAEDGASLAAAYREYAVIHKGTFAELPSDEVFGAIVECVRSVNASLSRDPVSAVSVSSMTDTFTPFDGAGRPLCDSIMSFDARAHEEAEEILSYKSARELYDITGMPLHPMHPAFKMRWLAKHRPDIARAAKLYLSYEDFVLWRLGAEPCSSYSSSGRTFLFNNHTKCWDDSLLDYFGVDDSQLPRLCPSGQLIGTISAEAAALTGLPRDAKLISGGFDQACCATACGVFSAGDLADTTGTNEILYFIVDAEAADALFANNFSYSYHIFADTFSTFAHMFNAGGALKWYRNNFFSDKNISYDDITAAMPAGVTDVFFMPFLSGMGTPEMRYTQKGSFHGLTLESDKRVISKAILEGVTMELRCNLELASSINNAEYDLIKALGGAAKSPVWMQLKADICGKSFVCYPRLEAGAAGAAILAGCGSGVFSSAQDGYAAIGGKTESRLYEPDMLKHRDYNEKYSRYLSLREMIKANNLF